MKASQIKNIVVGTYNGEERYQLTREQLNVLLGKEDAKKWLENKCLTDAQTNKLSMKELMESMSFDSKIEELLKVKLNYQSSQMLFWFLK